MLRRHSLLNLRSIDSEDGSFYGSDGHSLLRSSAHHIRSEAVAVDSDPNAESRPDSNSPMVCLSSSALSEVPAAKAQRMPRPWLVMNRDRGSHHSVEMRRRLLLVVIRTERLLFHGVEAIQIGCARSLRRAA